MKYVLDVSIGLKWVLNEVDSAKALRLRDDYRNQVHELIAPDCFPLEAAHALTRAERRRLIADAAQFWVEIMAYSPLLFPSLPLAHRTISTWRTSVLGVFFGRRNRCARGFTSSQSRQSTAQTHYA